MAAPVMEDISALADELYEKRLRSVVCTEENIGKFISIDVDSGDYEIGKDLLETGDNLRARHPNARMFAKRIGYVAAFAIGGGLVRERPS